MWIKAIHKIPKEKIAFIVVSHLVEFSNKLQKSDYSKRGTEYFQRILRGIDKSLPLITREWTLKIVQVDDFLKGLEQNSAPMNLSNNRDTSVNPCYNLFNLLGPFDLFPSLGTCNLSCNLLGLLSINQSKNSDSTFCKTHFSGKSLGVVDKEDIIEVFI